MSTDQTVQTEKGVFFWVFLGPISLLLSLSLLLFKTPANFAVLPVVLLVGITLTWLFRLKGLLISLALLIAATFYEISANDETYSLWFLGSMVTIAFSYLITFLTLEEAKGVISHWREEALVGSKYLSESEQKITELENKFSSEKGRYQSALREVEEKHDILAAAQETHEKVQELSRIELLSTISKLDAANDELYNAKIENRKLADEVQILSNSRDENLKEIDKLEKEKIRSAEKIVLIDTLSREKELLESTLNRLQAELDERESKTLELQALVENYKESAAKIEGALNEASTQVICLENELKMKEQALALAKEQVGAPQVEEVSIEGPPATDAEHRRLFGMHKQLKDQFKEKSSQLDDCRKELFFALEKVNLLELDIQELKSSDSPDLQRLTTEIDQLLANEDRQAQEIKALESLISQSS